MAILEFDGKRPRLGRGVYVDPTARVLGEVELRDNVAVWFSSLVKGESRPTVIGEGSVITEQCFVEDSSIGKQVLVSHRAILHRCVIGDRVLIGIGAVILDEAQIGAGSIIGAGSLITANTRIPERTVAFGVPAGVFREVGEKDDELFNRALEEVKWKTSRYMQILGG